jgi:hypothetical protein
LTELFSLPPTLALCNYDVNKYLLGSITFMSQAVNRILKKAGGSVLVQQELEVSRQVVSLWRQRGIPEKYAPYFLMKGIPLSVLSGALSRQLAAK